MMSRKYDKMEKLACELLRSLHAFQELNERIVNIISYTLNVDAKLICKENGIVYNV